MPDVMKNLKQTDPLIIYQTEDGKVKIETHFENESVWLSQTQIGELFQKSKATISEHIKNILKDGELDEKVVVRFFRTTTPSSPRRIEGVRDILNAYKQAIKKKPTSPANFLSFLRSSMELEANKQVIVQ